MKVKLLPRKEFEFNGIKGQFGTWALKRFCDLRGYKLSELHTKFTGDEAFDDVACFLLAAVEYKSRLDNEEFNYQDVHAFQWIDDMGGIASTQLVELINHASSVDDDKKKAVKAKG